MLRPESLKVSLLLASLALAGGGIALVSSARNSQLRVLTPVPGAESATGEAGPPAPVPAPAATAKIPDDIQWRTDFDTALQEARASGKPLMVDFYTDWCGYCKKLDAEVYTDFGVIAESANFVSVKINAEKNSELAAKYQVSGFPTIIWLDGNGAPIETLPGYADAPEFLQIMRRVRAKSPVSSV